MKYDTKSVKKLPRNWSERPSMTRFEVYCGFYSEYIKMLFQGSAIDHSAISPTDKNENCTLS